LGAAHDHAGHIVGGHFGLKVGLVGHAVALVDGHHLHAVILGIGLYHAGHNRVYRGRDEHLVALAACGAGHHHGLGSGGATVIHRGVAHFHACELGHHALVLKDVLQGALRNFGLIGGVGGEKLASLDYAFHHSWAVVVIASSANHALERLVFGAQLVEELAHLDFAHRVGEGIFSLELQLLGYVAVQVVETRHPAGVEHRFDVALGVWKIFEHCFSLLNFECRAPVRATAPMATLPARGPCNRCALLLRRLSVLLMLLAYEFLVGSCVHEAVELALVA
jgi:hypothetical protein